MKISKGWKICGRNRGKLTGEIQIARGWKVGGGWSKLSWRKGKCRNEFNRMLEDDAVRVRQAT